MPSNPLFTLSRKGLLRGVGERIDRVMAYYLASSPSQNELYANVVSLSDTIQKSNSDPTYLKTNIASDLQNLFSPIFDSVTVNVAVTDTSTFDHSNRLTITADIIVYEGGVPYSVGKELTTVNGIFQRMVDYNNTGN